MTAKALRTTVFRDLKALGFSPAKSLPMPDMKLSVRPAEEIASRLLALEALFVWVAFPVKYATTARAKKFIGANDVRDWLTEEEVPLLDLSRAKANKQHANTIGWKLENMWALAWVLGFDPEPNLAAELMGDAVIDPMLYEFLPNLDGTLDGFLAKCKPRAAADVIALEYRFYCAHNTVRSAQLGGDTVPDGFDPILHGGAVHERRHSLTWCLSNVDWDDTDLST